ncbi:MAG: zinc-dependent peptidase [Burkholderiaceae bacterium]|nr:zinc-dependent peptidase [Burkholderiaceae bacterium]
MFSSLFRARQPVEIDERTWRAVLDGFGLSAHLDAHAHARLRALCGEFLADKTISGARGFEVTPLVRAAIAYQACLPVLELGLSGYEDFVEVIVYPAQFLVPRTQVDEAGVVHESVDALSGEAMERGPIVLSWADVAPDAQPTGWSVAIHEFVHKLDMADGEPDGVPPLAARARARWRKALHSAYRRFCRELDSAERAIPRDVDPESEAADRYFGALALDPYAATDHAEFFAVSGEAFFVSPDSLADAFPDWYAELAAFFRQDPRNRAPETDAHPIG